MPSGRPLWAVVIALMLAAASSAQQAAPATAPPPAMTRYDALVAALPGEGEDAQRRYAETALTALIDAYGTEVGGTTGAEAAPVWRRGTRDFIARLQQVRGRLRQGARVTVVREGQHAVRLIVDDEQVMVSAPRDAAQAAFEARIAASLCAERDCGALTPTVDERVDARERSVRGEWSLADRAPPIYQQDDGLHCVFDDTRHLRLKQRACEALTRELRLLEEALRALLQHGGHIEWTALRVGPGPAATAEVGAAARRRVSYDASGRYFELDLPLLAAAPAVVRGAVPWLQTRLRGQTAIYVIAAPERLAYRVPDTH